MDFRGVRSVTLGTEAQSPSSVHPNRNAPLARRTLRPWALRSWALRSWRWLLRLLGCVLVAYDRVLRLLRFWVCKFRVYIAKNDRMSAEARTRQLVAKGASGSNDVMPPTSLERL